MKKEEEKNMTTKTTVITLIERNYDAGRPPIGGTIRVECYSTRRPLFNN